MTTRLKRPSLIRKLAIAVALIMFQVYLGYHLVEGNFGVRSQKSYIGQLAQLKIEDAALDHQIEEKVKRNSLLRADRLDPDLIGERAFSLLGWGNGSDIIIPASTLSK